MIQKEGAGWQLARDTSRKVFTSIIGGSDWSVELNEDEWSTLKSILDDLIGEYIKIQDQLMPQEKIRLEMEREKWFGCIDGDSELWNLQLILQSDDLSLRGVECYWPAPAAEAFVTELRKT